MEICVMHRQVHVRKLRAGVQRRKPSAIVRTPTRRAIAPAVASIPRVEVVTRTERQPTDGAAKSEAKSDSEAKPRAEAKERNIGRSPDRTIVRIPVRRTRPPSPTSVHIHPAAVVIRSPAPIIVGNPGPSPIRFINPAPVAVRSPIRWHGRTPHLTVIRNLRPGAVPIKILRAHVIIVGLLAPFRVADHVVAIAVPLVKVVARGRFPNLVLLVCTRTL